MKPFETKLIAVGEEAKHELQLLNIAWDYQQQELENLRLSLEVRTAQRDKAEARINALEARLSAAEKCLALIGREAAATYTKLKQA